MKKTTILSLLFTLPLLAFVAGASLAKSQSQKLEKFHGAVLHFCAKNMMGCAKRVDADGKSYLLVAENKKAQKSLDQIEGAYAFHHMLKTQPGELVGYTVREKGHFPNPMVEFDVLKVVEADFALPK